MKETLQAFVFPGQGTQRYIPEMSAELLSHQNTYVRQTTGLTYEEAADVLSLTVDELTNDTIGESHRPGFTEPAILTLSIAALRALHGYDLYADVVAGHSMGEISALVAAEALSFEQALRLVRERGKFMKMAAESNPGKMAVVLGLTIDEVEAICRESGAEIANINAPNQIVISGKNGSIDYATSVIKSEGARVAGLEISIAGHSSLMGGARNHMAILLQDEIVDDPKLPFVQNLTGDYATTAQQVKRGLIDGVSGRVLWMDIIKRMKVDGVGEFIEVGPGKVLSGLIKRIDSSTLVSQAVDKLL